MNQVTSLIKLLMKVMESSEWEDFLIVALIKILFNFSKDIKSLIMVNLFFFSVKFFIYDNNKKGIKRAIVGGKPSGECFVIFETKDDA